MRDARDDLLFDGFIGEFPWSPMTDRPAELFGPPAGQSHNRDGDFRDEWLTLSADTHTIPADSSYHVDVTFDATNL